MATPEQIQTIMTKIHQLGPRPEAFARIQSSAEGAKAVMICRLNTIIRCRASRSDSFCMFRRPEWPWLCDRSKPKV